MCLTAESCIYISCIYTVCVNQWLVCCVCIYVSRFILTLCVFSLVLNPLPLLGNLYFANVEENDDLEGRNYVCVASNNALRVMGQGSDQKIEPQRVSGIDPARACQLCLNKLTLVPGCLTVFSLLGRTSA